MLTTRINNTAACAGRLEIEDILPAIDSIFNKNLNYI